MSFDIIKGMATTFKNIGKKPTTSLIRKRNVNYLHVFVDSMCSIVMKMAWNGVSGAICALVPALLMQSISRQKKIQRSIESLRENGTPKSLMSTCYVVSSVATVKQPALQELLRWNTNINWQHTIQKIWCTTKNNYLSLRDRQQSVRALYGSNHLRQELSNLYRSHDTCLMDRRQAPLLLALVISL